MKTLLFIIFACLFGGANSVPTDNFGRLEKIRAAFEEFSKAYDKTYQTKQDEALRFDIFAQNFDKVMIFNIQKAQEQGFHLGINHLADLKPEEYHAMNGFRFPKNSPSLLKSNNPEAERYIEQILAQNNTVPDEVDWRKVPGRVSSVKNQGQCGSCWAFSTTGLLEGQEVPRKLSKDVNASLVELSEQDLVDCSKQNEGCNGGFMQAALQDIAKLGGIESETDYPYKAHKGKCRFSQTLSVFDDKGGYLIEKGNEKKLKEIVAKYGPVAVAIDASSIKFQLYRKGVYYNKHCKNKESSLDHGVLVVGYGTDPKQGDYWIVKNSWSEHWGEKGYIKMARNKKNHCGIATAATVASF